MNTRERFLRIFSNHPVDQIPDFEFGYWAETLTSWHGQGLPQDVENNWKAERYFALDYRIEVPVSVFVMPPFTEELLEDHGDRIIMRDIDGIICERFRDRSSIPRYLKYPIKMRKDWEQFKNERLQPDIPGRYPPDWEEKKNEWKRRDYPLGINCGSLYGWLRNWMGVENLSVAFYEDPDWVEEMMEHLTNLTLEVIKKALAEVKLDYTCWWEDMAYNKGPLLSPKLFMEFMVPRYKRITSLLKEYGVIVNILDCDGKIDELVPGWLEAGINCMFPLEAAHTDAFVLKEKYGKDIFLLGAVNKVALIKGQEAIDRELERIARLIDKGGFIPHVDHLVPPDVTLENYCYYLSQKRKMIGFR